MEFRHVPIVRTSRLTQAISLVFLVFLFSCVPKRNLGSVDSLQGNQGPTLDQIFPEDSQCPLGNEPTYAMLKSELINLYATLAHPHVGSEAKREGINRVAHIIDRLCERDCDKLLQSLFQLNAQLHAPEFDSVVEKYIKIPSGPQGEFIRPISPEKSREVSQRLVDYFSENDGQRLTMRIQAFIELLRHVAQLNAPIIFALADPNARAKTESYLSPDSELQAYLGKLYRQGHALFEITKVVRKFGPEKNHELDDADAKALAKAINDLGFFYAKFAQSFSNLAIGMGGESPLTKHFQKFQDGLDPMAWNEVVKTFQEELGVAPEKYFDIPEYDRLSDSFRSTPQPIATATIAQTYKWKLWTTDRGSRDVIVKVQRPGRAQELAENVALNQTLVKLKDVVISGEAFAPAVDLVLELILGFEKSVAMELDFKLEARNLRRARSYLGSQPGLNIPEPIERYSSRKILVMELAPGQNIQKMINGTGDEFDPGAREDLFIALLDSVMFQALGIANVYGIGWVHADMHPGNLLATPDGQISIVDWANTFESGGLIWQPMAATLAFIVGNENAFADALKSLARADSSFRIEAFRQHVRKRMDTLGLSRIQGLEGNRGNIPEKWNSLTDRIKLVTGEHTSAKASDTLSQEFINLLNEALKDYGWIPTERYASFLRTMLPTIMSLRGLMENADQERVSKLLQDRWWRVLLYQWPLRLLYGHLHHTSSAITTPIANFVLAQTDKAARFMRDCRDAQIRSRMQDSLEKSAAGFGDPAAFLK